MNRELVQLTEDMMLMAKNPCLEIHTASHQGDIKEFDGLAKEYPDANLVSHRCSYFVPALERENVEIFCEHAERLYAMAFASGIADALPKIAELAPQHNFAKYNRPVAFVSKVNLPGDWDGDLFYAIPEIWMKEMEAFLTVANNTAPKRKSGRRRKEETATETKIIGCLKTMLNNRGDDGPPTGKEIAEVSEESSMSVSRFVRKHFGGQAAFEKAWRNNTVGVKLAKLEYLPEQHTEYDDGREPKKSRRLKRTPGSNSEY